MDANELRDALQWDRRMIVGIAIVVFALLGLVAVQLILMRASITDARVMITALTMRVDSIDEHGTRALAEHRLEAHDRAK
jgi:hypothetical protein